MSRKPRARPMYEAEIHIKSSGSILSSLDTVRQAYQHGSDVLYRTVLRYPPRRVGGETIYEFGSIKFRLIERGRPTVIVDLDENPRDKEIFVGGVKAGEGRNLTGRVFFVDGLHILQSDDILDQPRARVLSEVFLESEMTDDQQEISWITYYVPEGQSFGLISEHHVKFMPKVGLNVNKRMLDHLIWKRHSKKTDWGLLHPIFYVFQRFQRLRQIGGKGSIKYLKSCHRKIGGFDVADSDRISLFAVNIANQMDLIMVPSECSKKAYLDSGVNTRVEVVPHAVSSLYSSINDKLKIFPNRARTKIPENGVNVLFFFLHSSTRKGADVVLHGMRKILKERPEVNFILKARSVSKLSRLPRTTYLNGWLTEADLVRLYNACDILVSPARGGGLELNVLEALARGLVVVTSEWPAIQEYAERYVLTVKSTGKMVKPLLRNPIHTGHGVDPDQEHFYEQIGYAIDNLDSLKKKGRRYAKKIRKKYNWTEIAKLISEHLQGGKDD